MWRIKSQTLTCAAQFFVRQLQTSPNYYTFHCYWPSDSATVVKS